MKRFLLLILPLCMLIVFAACGNNRQPDSGLCEHSFGDWVIEKQVTCKDEGLLTRTCTKCSHIEATRIAKTNTHTEVIDPAIPATCVKTGLSAGKHCSVCEKVLVSQQETPIVAHTYSDKYDESCNVCDHIRDAECAHKETIVLESKAATCTEIGLTEGSKCKNCGEILVEQTVLSVLGHSYGQWVTVKGPTTTEEGLQERTCDCGAKETQAIEKLQSSVGLLYALNSDKQSYSVTGIATSTDTHIVIPDTYNGLPVTAISNGAFGKCTSLQSISIPDSIAFVGYNVFLNCNNLTYNIYGNAKYLGNSTNPYVVLIGAVSTDITSCHIHPDTKVIYEYAFNNCRSMTSVTIPDSVIHIGNSAFIYCHSLTSVSIPDSVTTIGNYAFCWCDGLTSISISNSVIHIGNSAFIYCDSLTSVTIPDSVITIGNDAFSSCRNLTSVTIPDSVTTIGDFAFSGCYNLTYNIYDNAEYLGNSKNPYLVLVDTISTDITSCNIHPDTKVIYTGAFAYCNGLTSVNIPDSVTCVGDSAFEGCFNLTYNIYDNAKYLGNSTNPYLVLVDEISTDITSCNIHSDTKFVYGDAFVGCSSLTSVTIPDSVISFGGFSFYNCHSLNSITYEGTIAQWGNIQEVSIFVNPDEPYKIYCKDGTIANDGTVTYY